MRNDAFENIAAPYYTFAMNSPYVYDKAKYHSETIEKFGLSDEHAANHTVMFLRWLIEHRMMSDFFEQEAADILRQFRSGEVSAHAVYEWWDGCLIDEMLSDEGNTFAKSYFDFENGSYISDYIATLKGRLLSEFHVDYTEANYHKMAQVINRRYAEHSAGKAMKIKKRWWPF